MTSREPAGVNRPGDRDGDSEKIGAHGSVVGPEGHGTLSTASGTADASREPNTRGASRRSWTDLWSPATRGASRFLRFGRRALQMLSIWFRNSGRREVARGVD
jgi:hypothetical protein